MGFLARAVAEQKSMDPLAVWAEMLRAGRSSMAGPTITLENALKVATMFACLRVLSQGVAQVPLKVFREVEQGGLKRIEAAKDHRLYDLLAFAPQRLDDLIRVSRNTDYSCGAGQLLRLHQPHHGRHF